MKSTLAVEMARLLQDALIESGWSNRKLARASGVSEKHVSRVLCGWQTASFPIFEEWAGLLGYEFEVTLRRKVLA